MTAKQNERDYYNSLYASLCGTPQKIRADWTAAWSPQNKLVLNALGDIKGKRILILGNGQSTKELMFLEKNPSCMIYSDLSPVAVGNVKNSRDFSGCCICFAAIDAYNIPFPSGAFDIVYAYAMVHHLSDIGGFLKEVYRVLDRGGKCVFMDDAYSPIWHWTKQTIARPLVKRSHSKGISPEDYRFSMSGGFKERDLSKIIKGVGGSPWFERTAFITYAYQRAASKILKKGLHKIFLRKSMAHFCRLLDRMLLWIPYMDKNQIRLVWGFYK